jgi:general L-amino acid transport system permease protein
VKFFRTQREPKVFSADVLAVIFVAAGLIWLGNTILESVRHRGLSQGFQFLSQTSGFDIAETLPLPSFSEGAFKFVSQSSESSYTVALLTGLFNTAKVAFVALIGSVIFGIGLSTFLIFDGFSKAEWQHQHKPHFATRFIEFYIKLTRSVPLLLQLLFWYAFLLKVLPEPELGIQLGNKIFLNNRGLFLPFFAVNESSQLEWQIPELIFGGRNVRGGLVLTPEFLAIAWGLIFYTSSFVAELLRSSTLSIPSGQWVAARALGLSQLKSFQCVVFPQAKKIATPALMNTALSLVKNSTLGIAVGYPDIMGVGSTIVNQTGQTLEIVFLWLIVFSLIAGILKGVEHWSAKT